MTDIAIAAADDVSAFAAALGRDDLVCVQSADGFVVRVPDEIADVAEAIAVDLGPARKAWLAAYAANERYKKEVGGMFFNGSPIATDDRSQSKVMGLRVKADASPDFSTKFKATDGSWIDVNAASIIALSDAVFAHVNEAFALEEAVATGIASGDISTVAQIAAAFA